jgi:hypothetical protein
MNWTEQAIEKLKAGAGSVKGQKEVAMKGAVLEALTSFCKQDQEFAQAVVQGGSFQECMTAVAKGTGNSISDLDAYQKAVRFYFPGAEIRWTMTIDLIGAAGEPEVKSGGIMLDLADFL